MADWRQIQARIRRAKASSDPPGQLAALYEKTRDAMVALELARLHEQSGQNEEAVRWYTAAAQRFRRAQWKTKAEEALTRLGAPLPVAAAEPQVASTTPETPAMVEPPVSVFEHSVGPSKPPLESAAEKSSDASAEPGRPHRRRRGRRGGRGRRHGKPALIEATPERIGGQAVRLGPILREPVEARPTPRPAEEARELMPPARPGTGQPRPEEPAAAPAAWQVRGRAGEPALASRLAQLESQLRRLLASPLYRLDEADQAPAGPGVFILSDSDQTTYYFIEDCQTLRIGIGNLLRAERGGRRGGDSLRARFAEHLGISESRVSKYLKEHCAVRWVQLDEGAAPLAHFAIAVLRPALND